MNIKHIIQSIFKPREQLQDEVVIKFLQVLENIRAEELTCSETYARLDEFVETEVHSRTPRHVPGLQRRIRSIACHSRKYKIKSDGKFDFPSLFIVQSAYSWNNFSPARTATFNRFSAGVIGQDHISL